MCVTGVRWAESNRRKQLHGVADIQTRSKKLHQEDMETNATSAKVNKKGGLVFMDDNSETRRMVEQCYVKRKTTINPIVDWSDDEVWEFLNEVAKVPHCSLYDEGCTRLGCVGCPLQGREGMLWDFERWPRYKDLYIRAFDKMIQNHPGEIKVASGEMVDNTNTGGVQRYTQDGSHGTPDGLRPGHATDEQAKPGEQPVVEDADGNRGAPGLDKSVLSAERERERERETRAAPGRVDRTADIRPLDLEPRPGRRQEGTATTPARSEWKTNKIPGNEWWRMTAQENFDFWISNS